MITDQYGRVIDYLRISLTDRCNFRCIYCMPPEGCKLLPASEILSYEELLRVIAVLGHYGVNKIRFTGGEPLLRRGVTDFIYRVNSLPSVRELSMTTNGSLLAFYAKKLKASGLSRVNISIDTFNSRQFALITGGGQLNDTLQGINSAVKANLLPLKLNVVLTNVLSSQDVFEFIGLIRRFPIFVRFIEYMPIGEVAMRPSFSIEDIKTMINQAGYGVLKPIGTILSGNGPAKYYRLPNARGAFGFITPISEHYCQSCNRIRLTANGKFKPCLLSDQEIDIKSALRSGCSDSDIVNLFYAAVKTKPKHHCLTKTKELVMTRKMFQIGG